MRSLSTSALGQPRLTMPMVGTREAMAGSDGRFVPRGQGLAGPPSKSKEQGLGLAPSLGSYGLYPPPWEEGGCGTPTSVVARRTLLFLPRLGPLATVGSVIEPRLSMPFQLAPTLADAMELSLLNRHRS